MVHISGCLWRFEQHALARYLAQRESLRTPSATAHCLFWALRVQTCPKYVARDTGRFIFVLCSDFGVQVNLASKPSREPMGGISKAAAL